jgi:Spy/CpxP family protein refolding chaperone
MKTMTRMAMMAAVMFLAVTSVGQAQGGGGGGGGRGGNRMMTVLKDSLKVSDAILAKADSISKAYAAQRTPLMEAARGGDADARTKLTDLTNKQNADIKALLTPDQQAQLDKIMAAMPGRRGGPPPTV